jgi:transposase
MIAAVRSEVSVNEPVLYVACELAKKQWKLAMTSGFGVAAIVRTVTSGDWEAIEGALAGARRRFGLPAATAVVSCYEAGRDGFWIHRALVARAIANRVVDSSSIDVKRRHRRMKTDRIDALKLVHMLVRACAGEADVWSEVRVPPLAVEAARHVSRERTALTQEQTRLVNQLRSGLATMGAALPKQRPEGWWTTVRDWAGEPLPVPLQQRFARVQARLRLVADQIATLESAQHQTMVTAPAESAVRRLVQLKGVATTSAAVLMDEGLVWRAFTNRRQVGGLLGFAPLKYESGDTSRDQGISRAGNDRLQGTMVQLAWSWVHRQPHSALTRWYLERFGTGKRVRKIGIVALARKLLIALWRWATAGIVPTGAVLKAA